MQVKLKEIISMGKLLIYSLFGFLPLLITSFWIISEFKSNNKNVRIFNGIICILISSFATYSSNEFFQKYKYLNYHWFLVGSEELLDENKGELVGQAIKKYIDEYRKVDRWKAGFLLAREIRKSDTSDDK